jgi:hypothetical protein
VSRQLVSRVFAGHGWSFSKDIRQLWLTRQQARETIASQTRRNIPVSVQRGRGELLAAMDLLPDGYDYVSGALQVLAQAAAGFYDPVSNVLFLLGDVPEQERRATLVHELVHAAQDERQELSRFFIYSPAKSDGHAAVSSFAEGDAVFFSQRILKPHEAALSAPEFKKSLADSLSTGVFSNVPSVLISSLVANYVDGYRFVQAMYARGGVAAINSAWRRLPRTTEQLLHIDKYLIDEAPRKVSPPAAVLPKQFAVAVDDVLGEQSLRLVLQQWFSPSEAMRAAAGWGGDRTRVFVRSRGSKQDYATAIALRFDRRVDAKEFLALLRRRWPSGCVERKNLGPVAYGARDQQLWIVFGPHTVNERFRRTASPDASCKQSQKWLKYLSEINSEPEGQLNVERE